MSSVSARKQILRTNGRCFNCLRRCHIGRNCRSPRKCIKCNGRHHSSIREGRSFEPTQLSVDRLIWLSPRTCQSHRSIPKLHPLLLRLRRAILAPMGRKQCCYRPLVLPSITPLNHDIRLRYEHFLIAAATNLTSLSEPRGS